MVRCELIVRKCLPVLLYGVGAFKIGNSEVYRLHIAYRKIFRYIFNLPLWARISELLNVCNIKPIAQLIEAKELNNYDQTVFSMSL